MKFIEKIQKFMYGRYGHDELNKLLYWIIFILLFTNIFLKNGYVSLISLILLIIVTLRFTSRKIYKRSNANQKYLKLKNFFTKPFKNIKRNFKDRKVYVYKKCKHCKTTLRLPLPMNIGFKKVKCPNCKKEIKVLVLRKQKVEIIKNSK